MSITLNTGAQIPAVGLGNLKQHSMSIKLVS
jgi:hypothetical protein